MHTILEYRGPIQIGDQFGIRKVIGIPFLIRRDGKRDCRDVYIVVECRCGKIDAVKLHGIGAACRSCNRIGKCRGGQSRSRIYQTWNSMIHRCEKATRGSGYTHYRQRGIKVCDEWHDFDCFKSWAMKNGYEDHLTIERDNPNGDYRPGNCRFITKQEQNKNKRNTTFITAFGETKNLTDWCQDPRAAVTWTAIRKRISLGISPEDAISIPSRQMKALA